ncbi:MAG TPA: FAD:protein FMN transferase [Gemmataceae bacterium]|nr:FAD:protein FMN transferase [Gemmataceae bacterium]
MHRRDFLHPRHIIRAAGQVLGAADELRAAAGDHPAPVEDVALLRIGRQAMATTFEVLLPFGTPDALAIGEAALNEIDRLEAQLTVYRDDSEMSRINQQAADRPVPVEEGLFGLLSLAARITAETGGAFDITAGPLIKTWGFFRRQGRVPSDAERAEAMRRVGMPYVQLDPQQRTVRYLRPGMEMNLGSIGKGYALDRVAELLREWCRLPSALLHGGTSSVYAMGSEPGAERGWAVGIRHPWDPERRLAVVRLRNRALGTSAATFQYLEYNNRKLGHILDPRTGWPAEGLASATAVADTAAEADALATAFFILGVEKTRAYCESHPRVGAVLLPTGEEASPVVIGLDPEEIEQATEDASCP